MSIGLAQKKIQKEETREKASKKVVTGILHPIATTEKQEPKRRP